MSSEHDILGRPPMRRRTEPGVTAQHTPLPRDHEGDRTTIYVRRTGSTCGTISVAPVTVRAAPWECGV